MTFFHGPDLFVMHNLFNWVEVVPGSAPSSVSSASCPVDKSWPFSSYIVVCPIACATTTPPKKEKITKNTIMALRHPLERDHALVLCDKPCPSHEGLRPTSYVLRNNEMSTSTQTKRPNGVSSPLSVSAICFSHTCTDTCTHLNLTNVGCIIARNN